MDQWSIHVDAGGPYLWNMTHRKTHVGPASATGGELSANINKRPKAWC